MATPAVRLISHNQSEPGSQPRQPCNSHRSEGGGHAWRERTPDLDGIIRPRFPLHVSGGIPASLSPLWQRLGRRPRSANGAAHVHARRARRSAGASIVHGYYSVCAALASKCSICWSVDVECVECVALFTPTAGKLKKTRRCEAHARNLASGRHRARRRRRSRASSGPSRRRRWP